MVSVLDFDLNSQPRIGILPRKGVKVSLSPLSISYMPPITVVSPSLTRISVVASLFSMAGVPVAPLNVRLGLFLLALIYIDSLPSPVTCGVTVRLRLASTNCV
ncbi:MAG: hypothetical protein HW382_965 [Deltaproteobacteria bacterium]|nr:hypothetical protein [Deltaproteobacteria bacterium]